MGFGRKWKSFGGLSAAKGPRLTVAQVEAIRKDLIQQGTPVRFLYHGQNLNIATGDLMPRGTNVMHQIVYWNFTRETAKKVAKWLGAKAVF